LLPGDIVIRDNLGSHKSDAVRRAIRQAGARLFFLPKYSPYFNQSSSSLPSSNTGFAKLKKGPSRPSTMRSVLSSNPSRQTNAQTISSTLDMNNLNPIPL